MRNIRVNKNERKKRNVDTRYFVKFSIGNNGEYLQFLGEKGTRR